MSERAIPWFKAAGVELALTTVSGRNPVGANPYALKRWDARYMTIEDRFDDAHMRLWLSGGLDWTARFRKYQPGT